MSVGIKVILSMLMPAAVASCNLFANFRTSRSKLAHNIKRNIEYLAKSNYDAALGAQLPRFEAAVTTPTSRRTETAGSLQHWRPSALVQSRPKAAFVRDLTPHAVALKVPYTDIETQSTRRSLT
jgi:hypothetical protein